MGSEQFNERSSGEHRLTAAERQVQALQLRRAGLSYREIAARLNFAGPSGAYQAIWRGLRATLRESADALRSLELERLDRLQLAAWGPATANPPNLEATRTIIRLMQRRARLLGLDAPAEVKGEILYRSMAEQIAREENVSVEQILAEAERIVDEARRGGA